jgi:hypothetical protein
MKTNIGLWFLTRLGTLPEGVVSKNNMGACKILCESPTYVTENWLVRGVAREQAGVAPQATPKSQFFFFKKKFNIFKFLIFNIYFLFKGTRVLFLLD